MADPVFLCSKVETEAGKPQLYEFYTLFDAITESGETVKVRGLSMISTASNLAIAFAQAQHTVSNLQKFLSLIPAEVANV